MKKIIYLLMGLLVGGVSTGVSADAQEATTSSKSALATLSQQTPNAIAWALAPLQQSVPDDIRQNLTCLREDLLDEGKSAPKTSLDAYGIGSQLCNGLIAALDERDRVLVSAGYRAAQADANTKVSSQALEARRNYMMSWPQYAREQDQRGEIQRQQNNSVVLVKESIKVEWVTKSAALRKSLDTQYAKYREALRQDPNFQRSTPTFREPVVTPPVDPKISRPEPPTPTPSIETNKKDNLPLSDFEAGDLISPLFRGSRWVGAKPSGKEINDLSHTIAIDAAVGALGTSKSMRWNYKFEKVTVIVNCLWLNPSVDLTMFDTLSFYVKGLKAGHGMFRIESATPEGRRKHVHMGGFRFTPQWQKVTIDLRDPSFSGIDLTKTTQIGFVHGGTAGDENTIWIDEISCHRR